jgi:hypothetical protein
MKAIEQGVAREKLSRDELYKKATQIIQRARAETALLMKEGLIPMPKE